MRSVIKIGLVWLLACVLSFGQTTVKITGNIKATSSAVVAWTDGGGGTQSYTIKRSEVQGGPYTTIQTGFIGTTFIDLGCQPGHTYYYVIAAVNANGSSANSSEVGPARIP